LRIFGFLAPNWTVRVAESPRVDGSIPSLAIISNLMIRNGFRASPADYREVIGLQAPWRRIS